MDTPWTLMGDKMFSMLLSVCSPPIKVVNILHLFLESAKCQCVMGDHTRHVKMSAPHNNCCALYISMQLMNLARTNTWKKIVSFDTFGGNVAFTGSKDMWKGAGFMLNGLRSDLKQLQWVRGEKLYQDELLEDQRCQAVVKVFLFEDHLMLPCTYFGGWWVCPCKEARPVDQKTSHWLFFFLTV